ncbi:hypothetical protein BTJ40_15730 [Microbulbifer sp. A4B17]|uniref:hypothetical protein n=1 Tax=Microbulbifer sp. A4B17 TaxID=359370 RepID=UPI000D52AADB|nr:hypothetical protein [Microbulbifer sp. A4B17]AWF82162.1 hypothetical protein BTJ40_15730 [Microbulbifer sp. A4B17]
MPKMPKFNKKLYFAEKSLSPQIHVRYSYGSIFNNIPDKMGSFDGRLTNKLKPGIDLAMDALNYVHSRLSSGSAFKGDEHFKYYLKRYFFIDDIDKDSNFLTLYTTIKMMKTGLGTNKTVIKVYSSPKDGTEGYVVTYFKNAGDHTTPGFYTDTSSDTMKRRRGAKGDIHMESGCIKSNSNYHNAVTFLHEASHKYASTADFGEKGYTVKNTGAYREGGLTTEQALINAESYGKFIMDYYIKQNSLNIAIW